MQPLENLLVLEFSQYLSGPSAGLRLADLGARVIKIERPGVGEGGRRIDLKSLYIENDSLLFHTINRNKESYVADLKDDEDLQKVKRLIAEADVMTHNFRPGIMEKIGLGYEEVQHINPQIIYGVVSGYGKEGAWTEKPGQDLLVQSMSGLTFLSGDHGDPPTPFGLSVADILSGNHLVQGILASLVKRGKTSEGSLVEVSLMESALDLQFEVITTYLNDGGQLPKRARKGSAHAYLGAPYGIYETDDGYIALAMVDLDTLGDNIDLAELKNYASEERFSSRDEIMDHIRTVLKTKTTGEWLNILEPADIWCAEVQDYQKFLNHRGYKVLDMNQELDLPNGEHITTTRCPIRIDEERMFNSNPAPRLGEHTASINKEFDLVMQYEDQK